MCCIQYMVPFRVSSKKDEIRNGSSSILDETRNATVPFCSGIPFRCSFKYLAVPNNSHLRNCTCALSQSLVRHCLVNIYFFGYVKVVKVRVRFNNSHVAQILYCELFGTATYLAWHRFSRVYLIYAVTPLSQRKTTPWWPQTWWLIRHALWRRHNAVMARRRSA